MSRHADPVVVGLSSTPGIYYAYCRNCGAYTAIGEDPASVERELNSGLIRGALTLQTSLPLLAESEGREQRSLHSLYEEGAA